MATMSVAELQSENNHLLCDIGRRGHITDILPELKHRGICVKWTRFSLTQMCSLKAHWDQELITMCYYLYTYYADRHTIICPYIIDLQPSYLSFDQFQESEGHFNGDCDVVVIV